MTRKRNLLLDLDALVMDGVQSPITYLEHTTGISKFNISKWNKKRVQIFTAARTSGMARNHKMRASVGKYPEQEAELYERFLWRRKYLRIRTNCSWLQRNMRELVHSDFLARGLDMPVFSASAGWCSRFNIRWNISYQCRTNKSKRPVLERLPQIARFHKWLIYGVQRSEPQRCGKYGRFPPNRMYHMDQVPVPFAPNSTRTLNMKAEPCEIKLPGGSGTEKRFCTLQVCICAQPDQQNVKLEIIFRGQGLRLKQSEKDLYAALPNVTIRWQKKAWADERISLDWLEAFREQTVEQGEVLLGMDGHGSQTTERCMTFMQEMGIVCAKTPPNCTDCVSPVDRNVGQAIKLKMARRYEADYEANTDSWDLPKKQGGLGDSRKRMLIARWASEAWEEFCNENQGCIRSSFVETGFLIAKDGSENNKICLWRKRKIPNDPLLRYMYDSVAPDGTKYNFDNAYEIDEAAVLADAMRDD
jgi:hypothetical protein